MKYDGDIHNIWGNSRFISNLVAIYKIIFYDKREILYIMKSVSFTFNNLDFVIDPFQMFCMDGEFTMVNDPIRISDK